MEPFFFDRVIGKASDNTGDLSRIITLCDLGGKELCRGFLTEVPSFTLSNNWSGAEGGIISKMVDTISGFVRSGGTDVDRILQMAQGDNMLGSLVDKVPNGKAIVKGAAMLRNSSIKSIDSLVKQYNGTTATISGLTMHVWYFADKEGADDPRKALSGILMATTGSYINSKSSVDKIKQLVDKATQANGGKFELTTEQIQTAADAVSGVAGIQLAPNGYQVDPKKAINEVICGTFQLSVGNIMRIKNIVISNIDFSISPYHVATCDDQGVLTDTGIPSWVNINLSFELAREFTPNDVEDLLSTVTKS